METIVGLIVVVLLGTGMLVWLTLFVAIARHLAEAMIPKPRVRLPHNLDSSDWAEWETALADEVAKRLVTRYSRISMGKDEPGRN